MSSGSSSVAAAAEEEPQPSDLAPKRKEEFEDPEKAAKKLCTDSGEKKDDLPKLEQRLTGIFSCTVCLDLPVSTIYQVRYS